MNKNEIVTLREQIDNVDTVMAGCLDILGIGNSIMKAIKAESNTVDDLLARIDGLHESAEVIRGQLSRL